MDKVQRRQSSVLNLGPGRGDRNRWRSDRFPIQIYSIQYSHWQEWESRSVDISILIFSDVIGTHHPMICDHFPTTLAKSTEIRITCSNNGIILLRRRMSKFLKFQVSQLRYVRSLVLDQETFDPVLSKRKVTGSASAISVTYRRGNGEICDCASDEYIFAKPIPDWRTINFLGTCPL